VFIDLLALVSILDFLSIDAVAGAAVSGPPALAQEGIACIAHKYLAVTV
jgi:hypothetical protein